MDDNEKRETIAPPQQATKNRIARRVLKGAVGAIPVAGSALAELADEVLPDHEAEDRERWEGEVTDGVNDLHGRVNGIDERTRTKSEIISGAAAFIAHFMAERCKDGLMNDWVTPADIREATSELTDQEILEGFGDLESFGLVDQYRTINGPKRFHLTQIGYEQLDHQILGWSTTADARTIAGIVARSGNSVNTAELERELGWPRRRLNPALRIVVGFIHPGRVSETMQPDYVTRHFFMDDAERAWLRRFAAGGSPA